MKLEYENVKVGITNELVTIETQTEKATTLIQIDQKTGLVVFQSSAPK